MTYHLELWIFGHWNLFIEILILQYWDLFEI